MAIRRRTRRSADQYGGGGTGYTAAEDITGAHTIRRPTAPTFTSTGHQQTAAPASLWRRHGFPTVEVAGVLRDGAPLLPLPLNTEIRNEEKDLNTSGILTAVEGLRRELATEGRGFAVPGEEIPARAPP